MAHEPIWRRFLRLTGPDPRADVDDELAFHMDELTRRYEADGMDTEAARRAARAQFGDLDGTRAMLAGKTVVQLHRAERREFWQRLRGDLRVSARRLLHQPGFTFAAVATLALGIGANAGVFSVVNSALIRPLPYPHADRIVRLYEIVRGRPFSASPPNFTDWRAQTRSFSRMAAYSAFPRTLTGRGDARTFPNALVTDDFFDVMDVHPAHGRAFSPAELVSGQTNVVILSDALWRTVFGGDEAILGRTIQLDGETRTVVGIMPPGFEYPSGAKMWTPWAFNADDLATQRGAHYLTVIARLKPGMTVNAAASEVTALSERMATMYPASSKGNSASGKSLRDMLVGEGPRRALYVLLGAVALVTLIACANVANLLLARGAARRREMSVRASLGARPRDLIGLALTESMLLAVVGGVMGVAVAWGSTRALDALRPESLRQLGAASVDVTVLAFTFGLSLLTGLLFGLAPALQAARAGAGHGTLRSDARGNTLGRDGWRTRGGLVAAELALAVMLLAGAGLMLRSFDRLLSVPPGFDAGSSLTFQISLPEAKYAKPEQTAGFFSEMLTRTRALPGVTAAEAISALPCYGSSYSISTYSLDGRHLDPATQPSTQIRIVTPGLFSAMGVHFIRGRTFVDSDRLHARNVVVISAAAARLLFNDVDPIGHSLAISGGFGLGLGNAGGEVVGIVDDIHDEELGAPPRPTIYFPHAQWPWTGMAVIARVHPGTDPLAIAPAVMSQIKALDPDVPAVEVQSMNDIVRASVAEPRFAMLLLCAFALVALSLAAVGIFGVISYVVGQRTREIGVRIALGAGAGTVVAETVRRALSPMIAGIAIGLAGALALTKTMTTLLFDVAPNDPATFAVVTVAIAAVAVVSAWLPARRASRVDPIVALRQE